LRVLESQMLNHLPREDTATAHPARLELAWAWDGTGATLNFVRARRKVGVAVSTQLGALNNQL
jgi:hypothetical protein